MHLKHLFFVIDDERCVAIKRCDPVKVNFLFKETNNHIFWHIDNYASDCEFLISISHYPPLDDEPCTINDTNIDGMHVDASLDECLTPGIDNGAVTVDVYFNDDTCVIGDKTCRSTIYIPSVKPTG